MAVALDSSAVVGFLDRGDAFHEAAVARLGELLRRGVRLQVSAVTYAEVLTAARLGHHDEGIVRAFFDELVGEVAPVDAAVGERAAELRGERRSLKMADALILATADLDSEVERVTCADEVARKLAGLLTCEVDSLAAGRAVPPNR